MTTRRTILKTGALLALAAGTAPTAAAHRITTPDSQKLQAALDDLVAAGASGALAEVRDAGWWGAEAVAALRYRTWTPQELLAFIKGLPPLFEPGVSFTYSNTNYILLGLVIQRATGKHYATEIRRRILGPAGLASTQLPGTNPYIAGPHSHGYLLLEDGEPLDITNFNPSVCGAAGEIVTTTSDLNRFYRALMTGRLLRPAELARMQTRGPPTTASAYRPGWCPAAPGCGGTKVPSSEPRLPRGAPRTAAGR